MSDSKPPLFGPGSQPLEEDDGKLEYMKMPSTMMTYDMPLIPEPEDTVDMKEAKALLEKVHAAMLTYKVEEPPLEFDLGELDAKNLGLINQILGEGEVSIVAGANVQAQESVLAGLWRVHHISDDGKLVRDLIEIAAYPGSAQTITFSTAEKSSPPTDQVLPDGVFNAPSVLVEISHKVEEYAPGTATHAINLTLLPQTEQDIEYIHSKLGKGDTTILSRGYGNCRITSTNIANVWWVQYYNSQDTLILNSIEIVDVPEVVRAAQEDIDESADRLYEILGAYK